MGEVWYYYSSPCSTHSIKNPAHEIFQLSLTPADSGQSAVPFID